MSRLATLAAPSGIMAAFAKRQADLKMSDEQLFAKTGLGQSDIDALASALATVDGEVFRKLASALGVYASIETAPTPPDFIGSTWGGQLPTPFGDLS